MLRSGCRGQARSDRTTYRLNWVQTVLSQPVGMPTSDGWFRANCDHSQPSKNARTSSPPRLVDMRLVSGHSDEVRGGEGASWVTAPGGGSTGTLCEVAPVMGGSDCEYGGGGTLGRDGSHELIGCSRLLVAVRYWDGDCVVADRDGKLGGEEVYMGPSG